MPMNSPLKHIDQKPITLQFRIQGPPIELGANRDAARIWGGNHRKLGRLRGIQQTRQRGLPSFASCIGLLPVTFQLA